VSDLCRHMAIINKGEVLLTCDPVSVMSNLNGKIWKKLIEKVELPALQASQQVISSRLFAGKTVVHVLADGAPDSGFEAVSPDLEDVYFASIKS
jgi:ABC-2 type transport system ATP-binding protein